MPALLPPVIAAGGLRAHRQPVITVEEFVVRPWAATDAPAVVAAYRDADIQRWHVRSMTDDEADDWVHSWSNRWRAETGAGWAVSAGDELLGRVGFRSLDLTEGAGEAAYWTVPGARGRGIAGRALVAITAWMFEQVGFHRLTLLHSVHNPASCRVALKAGYPVEATLREQVRHVDGWHDMHLHACLKPDQSCLKPDESCPQAKDTCLRPDDTDD